MNPDVDAGKKTKQKHAKMMLDSLSNFVLGKNAKLMIPPHSVRARLFTHQRQAVTWMICQENRPFVKTLKSLSQGMLIPPDFQHASGGILADEVFIITNHPFPLSLYPSLSLFLSLSQ